VSEKIASTLETTANDYSRADGFTMMVYENHPSDSRVKEMGNVCQTVTSSWGTGGGNVPFVQKTIINTFALQGAGSTSQNANGSGYKEEQSFTLNVIDVHGVVADLAVRRLTPIECERLQGFPDNYTNIKENCPDGPRYKALGNSMAVPVMKWIGERIERL